jgi:hypothetical protein
MRAPAVAARYRETAPPSSDFFINRLRRETERDRIVTGECLVE